MRRLVLALVMSMYMGGSVYAAQSTITEAEGVACMGEDKTRKETKVNAMADAKRKATESTLTYIKSESRVKDFALEKDILESYSNATIKIIESKEIGWVKDEYAGECYKIWIKAEVVPDEKVAAKAEEKQIDDPTAPLSVKVWTTQKVYAQGENIKVYLKGNKPFYARVVYKDASGNLIQLLPNPYRQDNYFNGGITYELPTGEDRFDLMVSPPFGEEGIIVYASTEKLGDVDVSASGGVYEIKNTSEELSIKTRGVKVSRKGDAKRPSEFSESTVELKTRK